MKTEFTTLIGTLHSFVAYGRSRKADGNPYSAGEGPAAAVATHLATLESVRDTLLRASFDFEVGERAYRKAWKNAESGLFVAYTAAINAAGFNPLRKAQALANLAKRRADYLYVAEHEVNADAGHEILGRLTWSLSRLQTAVASPSALFTQKVAAVAARLHQLDAVQGVYDVAWSSFDGVLQAQAGHLHTAYLALMGNTTPWTAMDARLKELMRHFDLAAMATIGFAPGDSLTPGWDNMAGSSGEESGT